MEENIPTRVQFTKFNQNRKNPVTRVLHGLVPLINMQKLHF